MATAVVPRVKPNIVYQRQEHQLESLRGVSPSFPPSIEGRCYKQKADDRLMEICLGTSRGCTWPSAPPMGSFTIKEIMAEGCEPFQNHLII